MMRALQKVVRRVTHRERIDAMSVSATSRAAPLLLLAAFLGVACSGTKSPNPNTGPTPATHLKFPILSGPHAVDCASCHGTFASFTQFDCLGCHTQAPTAAFHTTVAAYAYTSTDCYACHKDSSGAPTVMVFDPAISVTVTALIPRYAATSIVALSSQPETLPMGMDHATKALSLNSVACAVCHADAAAGVSYPGRLHSALANAGLAQPTACSDCHTVSMPTGFVGPTATTPVRVPPSGEMKHDAVAWSGGVPTTTRLVTAECGVCHASPSAALQATWALGTAGTAPARLHAALTAASLPQPASCLDCHANSRPTAVLTSGTAALPAGLAFDHGAAAALADCAGCHVASTSAWSGARFHLAGSATPTTCLPCHAGERPTTTTGWTAGYTASPFDYTVSTAGITHGDGLDCATCHNGPGTGGTWGGTQKWAGGHFAHGPTSVAADTCIVCHMSQRPDVVLGPGPADLALGFDHSTSGIGDCVGCHQATVTAGSYLNYFKPPGGTTLPGGDWQGGDEYPGSWLVSTPTHFVTVTSLALTRASPGALVTGVTSTVATLNNAMLHTSATIPAGLSPGPAATPDKTTCWHCHLHDAAGAVTNFGGAVYHAALTGYSATVGGTVTPLPQPTSGCLDCHAQMHPPGIVERTGSDLLPMDHTATFTSAVTIGGQVVTSVAGVDCAVCHKQAGTTWTDGVFHASIGTATPADCTACHYPLMADAPSANVVSGTSFAMAHASPQLTFQACATCHTTALGQALTPFLATDWKTGAYHSSVPAQPTACLDCHAVSEPAAGVPTQSSWTYTLAAGGTTSNAGQWMNHGALPVVSLDCVKCHAADARAAVTVWSKATLFHSAVATPGTCQSCHGLTNGGGTVAGTNNNLPSGLTSSSVLTTASANTLTGVPVGTHDQINHADVNVTAQDCNRCHTQVGRSAVVGVQGAEWAQATFHTSLSPAIPLVTNGTTGRCSNCHMNVKPGATFTAMDHSALTSASGTQDCSACHSWPGTGTAAAPNWVSSGGTPAFITVGGFAIPQPPATAATTQLGIASLPHPTVASGTTCATCHSGGLGGKKAIGYDHVSALINTNCSSCHEAGSNLVGTPWNGATTSASGAGDTRPYTLSSIVASKGSGNTCTITLPNHFYAVDCAQCHKVPTGIAVVTTGTAYTSAWTFPHSTSKMSNPSTCNLCHSGQGCPKG
jgi:hypothetical protein